MIPEKKIKVLFTTAWYPNRYDPMLGLFVKKHIQSLLPCVDPVVLYIHADEFLKGNKPDINFQTEDGIKTLRIYYPAKCSGKTSLCQVNKGIRYFKAVIKGIQLITSEWGKPEIIHVNILTRSGLAALWFKWFKQTPYIITEHWSRYMPVNYAYTGFVRKLLTKILVNNASAITVVSEKLKESMITEGLKNEYIQIPNVIDTDLFRPVQAEMPVKKTFTHISCFEDKSKNISGLLLAISNLSKERDDFIVNLVGEGLDWNALKKMSDDLGLTDKTVVFKGLLENEALNSCINQSSATILFSNYETFGIVLLESMSCGVPVISTRTGILPEIYQDFMGFMIDIKDENQLIEAMKIFLDGKFEADKNMLRNFILKNYSYPVVGQSIYDLYKRILK